MKTMLLATGNEKKGRELAEICGPHARVRTLRDVGLAGLEIVEDATTFAGNAWKKALAVQAALPAGHDVDVVLADDSGIVVDALQGRPGVRSARFSADLGFAPPGVAVDEANNRLLLTLLAPVPPERRTARYACHVVAVDARTGARIAEADGSVEGRIAYDRSGIGGFGYDPMFVVEDGPDSARGRRMAELSPDEKHAISHRGRALQALMKNPGVL